MKDVFEMGFLLTGLSFGVVPGTVAYVLCRYTSIWWRLIPGICIVASGLWAADHTAHGFHQFCVACIIYSVLAVMGLQAREKKDRSRAAKLLGNVDWLMVISFPVAYFPMTWWFGPSL